MFFVCPLEQRSPTPGPRAGTGPWVIWYRSAEKDYLFIFYYYFYFLFYSLRNTVTLLHAISLYAVVRLHITCLHFWQPLRNITQPESGLLQWCGNEHGKGAPLPSRRSA